MSQPDAIAPPEGAVENARGIDPEGFVFDVETGEVLGHVNDADGPFRVVSPEGADWVLGLMAAEEARLKAIQSRRAALKANLDAMEVEPRNRLAYLARRFGAELEEQARRDIEAAGGRTKTAKYPHGQVAFRMVPGPAEILDPAKALAYVEEWAPNEVKRSVGITEVRAAIRAEREMFESGEEPDVSEFFRSGSPRESATIRTGVMKEDR